MTLLGPDDPTVKMLRSGFGKQVKSPNTTEPAWGFGSSDRDASMKLYMSAEQTKAMHGNNSMGAVYKSMSAIGPQPESKYGSAPAPGFGTSSRTARNSGSKVPGPGAYSVDAATEAHDSRRPMSPRAVFGTCSRAAAAKVGLDEESMKTFYGVESPGPNSYAQPGSIGRMVDSKYSSQPSWGQGTSARFKYRDDSDMVGTFSTYNAVGKQVMSNKQTLPSVRIGTSSRDASKKIFISKEHEKGSFGENSPGPVTGQFVDSFGPQKQSQKKSNPSWGFGTGKRDTAHSSEAPGPGSYFA